MSSKSKSIDGEHLSMFLTDIVLNFRIIKQKWYDSFFSLS